MSLTPDEINKYRTQFNLPASNPTPPMVNGQSANDRMNFFFGNSNNTESQPQQPQDNRNILEKGADAFIHAPLTMLERTGEGLVAGGLKTADAVSGGAVDRFYQTHFGHTLDQGLQNAADTSTHIPIVNANIAPSSKDTPESIAGNAVQTVALGADSPAVAGAAFLGGGAMTENKGAGEVTADAIAGALGGKLTQGVMGYASPYVTKAIEKFGAPLVDKLSQYIPDAAKDSFMAMAEKITSKLPDLTDKSLPGVGDAINKTNEAVSSTVDNIIQKPIDATKNAAQSLTDKFKTSPDDATWDIIKPKLTPTEQAQAVVDGRIQKTGKLGTVTQVPKGTDLDMIEAAKPYVSTSKDPIDAVTNMQKGIADEANSLRTGLKQSTATWSQNNLKGVIKSIEKPDLLSGDLEKAFDKTMNSVLKQASTADKNLSGLLDVRQNFDKIVSKQYPNIYSSDAMTPIKTAVTETRNAINKLIEDKLPEGTTADGISFRDSLKKQSLLYRAIENASGNVDKVGSNMVDSFIKKNPKTAKALKYGIGLAGADRILKGMGAPVP